LAKTKLQDKFIDYIFDGFKGSGSEENTKVVARDGCCVLCVLCLLSRHTVRATFLQ